jgi:Tfp pilus assembly protein PilN
MSRREKIIEALYSAQRIALKQADVWRIERPEDEINREAGIYASDAIAVEIGELVRAVEADAAITSEPAAGDALTRQFNAAEELAERVMKLEDERADLQARLEKAEEALIAIEPWCVRTESVQLSTNKEYAAASNKVHAAIDAALSKKAGE